MLICFICHWDSLPEKVEAEEDKSEDLPFIFTQTSPTGIWAMNIGISPAAGQSP